ncbi:hypothetical protein ACSVH2_08600 [Flavobacterium sp. RSB2_4_14]|uniref:hypothetical protein n=1 Tax=Flavobacterium sp. RSB2_4_14 TaxID=3447665 RepID=UPI003F37B489
MNCELYLNGEIVASIITAVATIIAGLLVYVLSRGYYKHSKKIEHDKMLKELFGEFNARYDRINIQLDLISRISKDDWNQIKVKKQIKYTGIIYDFFNLCAEEYFWFKENRVSEKVWKSWSKGMNIIYNRSEVIQNIWKEESEKEGYISYYLEKKENFFKKE